MYQQLLLPSRIGAHNCTYKRFQPSGEKSQETTDPRLTPCKWSTAESFVLWACSYASSYPLLVWYSMGYNPTWDC